MVVQRRRRSHDERTVTVTVTTTVSVLPTQSHDVIPGPSTVLPAGIMSESMPTQTTQVDAMSSTATVRSGIVGGVVTLVGMGIVFAVVWVFRRHARLRRQVLGLKHVRSSESSSRSAALHTHERARCFPGHRVSLIPSCVPCAQSDASPITLPTPYSIYDHDRAETVALKLSPSPLVSQEEPDARAQPQPLEAASSYRVSSGCDLPPSYSSLGVGSPRTSVRPPQMARSKTMSSVSRHVRMSSRQERPELRITIPSRFLTVPVAHSDDVVEIRRFSALS